MRVLKPMSKSALQWYVCGGDPGNQLSEHCSNTDEVLDFCGRLLYSAGLVDVILLRIRRMEPSRINVIGDEFCDVLSEDTEWVMRVMEEDGTYRERQLASKHELLGMLLAELRLGRTTIDVRHITNICERS